MRIHLRVLSCVDGVVSDELEPVSDFRDAQVLGDEKVAPLAKRGVSFLFEPDSGVYVPFQIEVVVHRRMD